MSKRLKDIIKTQEELPKGIIENNMITKVEVDVIAHFDNISSFEIYCKNIVPYSGINNMGNIGHVIKAFIELMKLQKEDGIRLSEIKDVPCRLLFDTEGSTWGASAIGIGHFMEDRFILFKDLSTLGLDD